MDTLVISHRVVDFLKRYPPFQAMDEADLLELAAGGRVRFHEPNEYILWQGEPHRLHVFVIQQGTVSLWDEADSGAGLRDVRGTGDLLGIERFNGARSCLYSARSESDVVIYALASDEFAPLLLKYPHAAQYIAAEARVTPDYQPIGARRDPSAVFLHEIVGRKPLPSCSLTASIASVARQLLGTRAEAIAVLDSDQRARAVLTADTMLHWLADGGGDAQAEIASLVGDAPITVGPDASVADGVLAIGTSDLGVLAITADGTANGRIQGVVAARDLAPVFGENPAVFLRDIRLAETVQELRDLNQRARAVTLQHLTGAAPIEWLTRFTHQVDAAIVSRIVEWEKADVPGCWCVCGSSGRGESLTQVTPHLVVILEDDRGLEAATGCFRSVLEALSACDYLPRKDLPFEPSFYVASADVWKMRFGNWVGDPVRHEMYRARSLFDLRPIRGLQSLWQQLESAVVASIDLEFLYVLANDCLASLPPLTFFRDEVVDRDGEHLATLRLEHSALRPLVDVARVFALAAGNGLGRTTLERFAAARRWLPEQEAIFREAADTVRVVLWLQGRVGISRRTSGSELPPALLSRNDRQVLKSGFRAIYRLLEFTADLSWLRTG